MLFCCAFLCSRGCWPSSPSVSPRKDGFLRHTHHSLPGTQSPSPPQAPLRLDTDNSLFPSRRQAAPSGCTAAPLLWASHNPAFPTWVPSPLVQSSQHPRPALPASSSQLPGPAWNAHVAPAGSSRECPHVDSQLWVACVPAQQSLKVGRLHIFNKEVNPILSRETVLIPSRG